MVAGGGAEDGGEDVTVGGDGGEAHGAVGGEAAGVVAGAGEEGEDGGPGEDGGGG